MSDEQPKMKLDLTKPLLETNGRAAIIKEEGKPDREMTLRDLLLTLLGAQPATGTAKESFTLWALALQISDESKKEIELTKKQEEVLLKILKNPVSSQGQPLISQIAQAQLLLACGLTEEDL